jgi:hypothetical protein
MEQKNRIQLKKSTSKLVFGAEKSYPAKTKCVKACVWSRKIVSSLNKVLQSLCLEQKNRIQPEQSASKRVFEAEKSYPA